MCQSGIFKVDPARHKKKVGGAEEMAALATQVSVNTIRRVKAQIKNQVASIDKQAALAAAPPAKRGAKPTTNQQKSDQLDPDIPAAIKRHVAAAQAKFQPVSLPWLSEQLKFHNKIYATVKQLRRIMRILGYVFGRAGAVHYLKETPGNVLYRESYLAEKLANRREPQPGEEDTGRLVKRLEIYMDESYCNINHVHRSTWYERGKAIKGRTGVGQRANIMAAFAIGDLPDGRKICEVVPSSLAIWHGNNKVRGVYKSGDCGVRRMDETLKRMAKEGKEAAGPLDYHGNVNAPLFEDWLRDLCEILNARYGVPCTIYLDGAKSHKREKEEFKQPTTSWSKPDVVAWLQQHGHPEVQNTRAWPMKKLLPLAYAKKEKLQKQYVCYDIARDHGDHKIAWTPAYHPELQPIERLWAAVKNEIARRPVNAGGMTELIRRLWLNFKDSSEGGQLALNIMHMTYRKSREWEDYYMALANKRWEEEAQQDSAIVLAAGSGAASMETDGGDGDWSDANELEEAAGEEDDEEE